MHKRYVCNQYKFFILMKVKNFARFTTKMILTLIPFEKKSINGVYQLYNEGMLERTKCPENKRMYLYHITQKGYDFINSNACK